MAERRYPGEAPGKFRIANSTIEAYLKCGEYVRRERESKERRVTIAMAIGTGVSGGALIDNLAKIAGKVSVGGRPGAELVDIVDHAVMAYEGEVDQIDDARHYVRAAVDRVRDAARTYGEQVSPTIERVVLAEEKLVAEIDDDLELAGTPDCIHEMRDDLGRVVRDTKTGQPWNQARVDEHRQLTAYSILAEAHFGTAPTRVVIDSLVGRPRGWYSETWWSYRGEDDRAAYVELVRRVRGAIEAGIFLPAPANAWWCAAKWCPFARECEFFRGET